MFVYGNHLSGVITFLRTTKALSRRGKVAIVCFSRQSDSFLGATRSILRGRLLTQKKKLIQVMAVTSLTAVKIEERNEKSNSIRWQENSWQHRLISWYSASSLVCCTLLLPA